MDEENQSIYCCTKIFIEEGEKLYANDPIYHTKEEIYDDIIVEFGYDNTKEEVGVDEA